mmetsp:Transcript_36899/g.97605  ORF Transcript_36899/g.97605 Transcript_36899/m.97605 type:complete len:214 (-) Transcript_36899:753-1394(-)
MAADNLVVKGVEQGGHASKLRGRCLDRGRERLVNMFDQRKLPVVLCQHQPRGEVPSLARHLAPVVLVQELLAQLEKSLESCSFQIGHLRLRAGKAHKPESACVCVRERATSALTCVKALLETRASNSSPRYGKTSSPPGAKSRRAARTSARVARPSSVSPACRLAMASVSLSALDADDGAGASSANWLSTGIGNSSLRRSCLNIEWYLRTTSE